MTRFRLLTATVIALLGGVVSCVGILGFERLHVEGGDDLEASVADAADETTPPIDSGPDTAACGELGVPAPPMDAGGGIVAPVLVGLKTVDFGVDFDAATPNPPGLNLDRVCTTNLATSSCTSKSPEQTFDNLASDLNAAGLDNSCFGLVKTITGFKSPLLAASTLNGAIAEGQYGGVLRLTNWNGQPDDSDVTLEIFPSTGFEVVDGGPQRPSFTAADRWWLDVRFEEGPFVDGSSLTSQRAYVTGNQFVAYFGKITFPIGIADDPKPFDVIIQTPIMVGTLATENGVTNITQAMVTGRWKTSDFLEQVRLIYVDDSVGIYHHLLCEPDTNARSVYAAVKSQVCDGRDIRADDQDGKNMPCDAVSAALRIQGYPLAERGDFDAGFDAGERCTGADDIPSGADCDPN